MRTRRSPAASVAALSWALVATALSAAASGQPSGPERPRVPRSAPAVTGKLGVGESRLSLERALELAELNYPKIHEAKAKLEKTRAQLSEAHSAPFSQFKSRAAVGLAPTIRGTSTYSPNSDVALTRELGLGWQVGVEGVVPLWTFGKISNLWDAAEANVDVSEHEVQKEKLAVRMSVYQAYWGLQLAQDALALVNEALRTIDKHLTRLEEKVEEGDGDDIELLKMKINRAELVARESQARREAETARSGLRFLTGLSGKLEIGDEPLRPVEHRVSGVDRYLTAARLFRPEINMARAGVLAREAQVRLERARYFPDIGLGLAARYARAPEVTDQRNPYGNDQANFISYGAGLVLSWNLDFLPQSARLRQAQATLEAQRATERYALGGVAHEVEKAHVAALDAERRLEAWTEATDLAKQWLVKVQQGIDVGTMNEEDIVDPAKEHALKKFARLSATYEFNLAIANLAAVTGWEAVLPANPDAGG